jgi:deoxyribonuclease (pyrimidine dimer)
MTRINVVAPRDLTDQHLLAEYRELPRVFTLAQAWLDRGKPGALPERYALGTGHVKFFYDKTDYLAKRQRLSTPRHPSLSLA